MLKPSNSPPSNGWIGSTTGACSSRSETSRPPRRKPPTMPSLSPSQWPRRTQTNLPPGNPVRLMAIRGHVFCSFLALLLVKELEDRLHRHNIAAEWDDILRDLDRLQEIELEQDGKRFLLRTPTTGVAGKLFQAVGVALPPNLQELPLTTPQPAA